MTNYTRGRSFEWRIRTHLEGEGAFVLRSAGSKSPVDLVAFFGRYHLFVQCKTKGWPGPAERAGLASAASQANAYPLAVTREGRKLSWRGITPSGRMLETMKTPVGALALLKTEKS